MPNLVLRTGRLTLDDLRTVMTERRPVELDAACWPAVDAAHQHVAAIAREDDLVYGINTGFGSLAKTSIDADDVRELQRRLIRSHAVGTGPLLDDDVVRLVLILNVIKGHLSVPNALAIDYCE